MSDAVMSPFIRMSHHLLTPHLCSKCIKMSEAFQDPFAYTRLTDFVLQQIMVSADPNLREVRKNLDCGSVITTTMFLVAGGTSQSGEA